MNDKLDNSNYEADNNENLKQQIRYNNKTRLKDIEVKDTNRLKGVTKTTEEKKQIDAEQKRYNNKTRLKDIEVKDTKILKGVTNATIQQPTPATTSTSKKGKDDNSDDSAETNLGDDPENLKLFLSTIESYGIEKEDIDKIVFKGGGNHRKQQYPLLQKIAKELFQQNNSKEFLNQISDKGDSGKHKIKNVPDLKKSLNLLKKR